MSVNRKVTVHVGRRSGFSLDASVRVSTSDRAGRERLLRYCTRRPFALERRRSEPGPAPARASRTAPGAGLRQVLYHLPRTPPDGRTVLALSPLELLAALRSRFLARRARCNVGGVAESDGHDPFATFARRQD